MLEVLYTSVLKTVLVIAATAPAALGPVAILKQLIGNHSSRAATRCVGFGVKGPIKLRETKDLILVSLQNPGIGVDTILEKLPVNKTVKDLPVKWTIFGSEENNRYNQELVIKFIYRTLTLDFNRCYAKSRNE